MKPNRTKGPVVAFILMYTALFVSSCTSIQHTSAPEKKSKAYDLALKIQNINKKVKTSKGAGWITIAGDNKRTEFRMVWAAESPDNIRITLLNSGVPIETIVSSGKQITLFSHTGEHALKTYTLKNASLESIVSIPVRVKDIIFLLTGRIPIKEFDHAVFKETAGPSRHLVLKKRWGGHYQKILIDPQNRVEQYSVMTRKMAPVYKITFETFKTVSSVETPVKILIQGNSKKVLLDITRLSINPVIKKEVFSLTENG